MKQAESTEKTFCRLTERTMPMSNSVWEPEITDHEMQLENREFNLCDFALFLSVMKNKTAHRNVLSIITGGKKFKTEEVYVEEVILNKSGSGQSV